jgi:hypothetical protein
VVERVTKVEMTFFIAVDGASQPVLRRVVGGGGADLMLLFRLEMEGDRTKRYQKMKQCGDVGRRRGGTREQKVRRRH